jgi:hypothetical protein
MRNVGDDLPHRELMLKDACPELFQALISYLEKTNRTDLLEQLSALVIKSQALFGNPESFRFVVRPVPSLTSDQAAHIKFRDWENIGLSFLDGFVEVQLDNFGRIEMFYLSKLPTIYNGLLRFEGYIGP